MNYCKKCLFPETKPHLYFDEEGICSACKSAEFKKNDIDWAGRKKLFFEEIEKTKNISNPNYDCIVPVSGGKDSTYQAYFMKEVCGLNPLCVCFETTMMTELGRKNLDNISKLGVDLIFFKKNYEVYKKLVVEGFNKVGDEMWINHIAIYTYPVHIAIKFDIPLIIWGENGQMEYGSPHGYKYKPIQDRRRLEEFGGLNGMRVQDMVGVQGMTEKELAPYFYPSEEELEKSKVKGLFLGWFFYWDAVRQMDAVLERGFLVDPDGPYVGAYKNYENLDEKMHALHDYLKYVKYGFSRATDQISIEIRNERLSREEGVGLVYKHEGQYPEIAVNDFVNYSGMSKEDVNKIIDSYTSPILFKTDDETGEFLREDDYSLIRDYEIS